MKFRRRRSSSKPRRIRERWSRKRLIEFSDKSDHWRSAYAKMEELIFNQDNILDRVIHWTGAMTRHGGIISISMRSASRRSLHCSMVEVDEDDGTKRKWLHIYAPRKLVLKRRSAKKWKNFRETFGAKYGPLDSVAKARFYGKLYQKCSFIFCKSAFRPSQSNVPDNQVHALSSSLVELMHRDMKDNGFDRGMEERSQKSRRFTTSSDWSGEQANVLELRVFQGYNGMQRPQCIWHFTQVSRLKIHIEINTFYQAFSEKLRAAATSSQD